MMFWAKASTQEKKSCEPELLPKMTKRKRPMAETSVDRARVPRRPKKGEGESTR